MTTIKERLIILETKLSNVQKMQWIILTALFGSLGIEYIPLFIATLAKII